MTERDQVKTTHWVMNAFISYLDKIVKLPVEVQKAIEGITVCRQVNRHAMLLRNGNVCHEFHFLAGGLARVFYYKDGRDVTAWFAAEGGIVSAIDSLFTGIPSMYNIELLEDSEVYSLQYDQLEPIFRDHPVVERLGRLLVTHHYLLLDERMKLFAFCTSEERYERLIEQIPNVFQRAKLGHIASYLGMSQEHLSRIRAGYRK